jgi:ribulose-phosphate 3-epimerase
VNTLEPKVLPKVLIAPSILSADFACLGEEIKNIEKAGADWVHVDVMDGHFVDNLTLGPLVVAAVKKSSKIPVDVHLMIEKPELSFERYLKAGADSLTFHIEACIEPESVLKKIKDSGAKPGITLRPQTSLSAVEKYFDLVDLVLIMTVNPGWGGQSFMQEQLSKIQSVKNWADGKNPKLFIEVDGGINPETAKLCRDTGANVLVAGNAVFKSGDYEKSIREIRGK